MPGNTPNFTKVEQGKDGKITVHGKTVGPKHVQNVAVTLVRRGGGVLQGDNPNAKNTSWEVGVKKASKPLADKEEVFLVGTLVRSKPPGSDCDCDPPDPVTWSQWKKVTAL